MVVVTTTNHMACWLLGSSIGGTAFPQLLADDAVTLALAFLESVQVATWGCLIAVVS